MVPSTTWKDCGFSLTLQPSRVFPSKREIQPFLSAFRSFFVWAKAVAVNKTIKANSKVLFISVSIFVNQCRKYHYIFFNSKTNPSTVAEPFGMHGQLRFGGH